MFKVGGRPTTLRRSVHICFFILCFILNYFVFYARFYMLSFPLPLLCLFCAQLCHISYVLCSFFMLLNAPICPMPVYATFVVHHACFCFYFALAFIFHFPHTMHTMRPPSTPTADWGQSVLSRGEMMSTRQRQLQKSTKTLFPRPSPRSHDTPTHRTDAATFSSPLARFIIFYNIHTFLGPSPNILRRCILNALTGSPMREHLSCCYI